MILRGGIYREALAIQKDGLTVRALKGEKVVLSGADLIEGWTRDRTDAPEQTRIILTHANDEVRTLNDLARGRLREAGELGEDVSITVERGKRDFASGDRVMFLKNDRGLGIRNGSLGIVETVDAGRMTVHLDAGRSGAESPQAERSANTLGVRVRSSPWN